MLTPPAPLPVVITVELLHQPQFGQAMIRSRARRALTIREAARDSGISKTAWDRGEAGEDLRLSTVVKIVEWLGRHGPGMEG